MAACACVQDANPCIRDWFEKIGHLVISIMVIITVSSIGLGIYFAYFSDGTANSEIFVFISQTSISTVTTWITSFWRLYGKFKKKWYAEHKIRMNDSIFIVTYHDYEDVQAGRKLRRKLYPGKDLFDKRREQALLTTQQRQTFNEYIPKPVLKELSPRAIHDVQIVRAHESCVLEVKQSSDMDEIIAAPCDNQIIEQIKNDCAVLNSDTATAMKHEIIEFEKDMVIKGYDEGGTLLVKGGRDIAPTRQAVIDMAIGRIWIPNQKNNKIHPVGNHHDDDNNESHGTNANKDKDRSQVEGKEDQKPEKKEKKESKSTRTKSKSSSSKLKRSGKR